MRNDMLNAYVIQLVCLGRIIIQDREGQQHGVCCRGVNLQRITRKITLTFTDMQCCRYITCQKHMVNFKHLVNVFNSHTGDLVQQRRAVLIYLG